MENKQVIIICGTGIHKGAIEFQEYPTNIGFTAALKLFVEKFPQATQISLTHGNPEQ